MRELSARGWIGAAAGSGGCGGIAAAVLGIRAAAVVGCGAAAVVGNGAIMGLCDDAAAGLDVDAFVGSAGPPIVIPIITSLSESEESGVKARALLSGMVVSMWRFSSSL